MGKGDIKSGKGKLANGSFGNKRRRNETMPKAVIPVKEAAVAEVEKVVAKPKVAKAKKAEN
jgi:ribosomal small subunit protein bTHX